MNRSTILAATLLISVSGCGGPPRFDASNDDAVEASMKRFRSSLNEEDKKVFANDCIVLMMPDALGWAIQGAMKGGPRNSPSKSEIFKSIDGMTFPEIHAKAEEARKRIDIGLAKSRESIKPAKPDRSVVLKKAIDSVRDGCAENFGSIEADAAKITADLSGILEWHAKKARKEGRT